MAELEPNLDRVDAIAAGLQETIGLLPSPEQQILGQRLVDHFGWQTAGSLAVASNTVFALDRDDYDLTVTALGDLGVKDTSKIGVPGFEEVGSTLGDPTAAFLGQHVERGDKPELTIHIPLSRRGFSLSKLVAAFDAKQEYGTSVWEELWGSYTPDTHNGQRGNGTAHVLLNDSRNPADTHEKANEYDEAGLVYVNQTVPQQRESLSDEAQIAADHGVVLSPISFTEYMVVQAKRRQAGLPLLDKPTVTRFTQYPDKKIGGRVYVPFADVRDRGQLRLYGSDVGSLWDNYGVRRVVRVA